MLCVSRTRERHAFFPQHRVPSATPSGFRLGIRRAAARSALPRLHCFCLGLGCTCTSLGYTSQVFTCIVSWADLASLVGELWKLPLLCMRQAKHFTSSYQEEGAPPTERVHGIP